MCRRTSANLALHAEPFKGFPANWERIRPLLSSIGITLNAGSCAWFARAEN